MAEDKTYCGYIAIVGRPNTGKSTLLNYLLGQKISITSRKQQTTRHRILGIHTLDQHQIVYVDTPGIHTGEVKAINRFMNREADFAINDVDAIVFVVDAMNWTTDDALVLQKLKSSTVPVVLIINKIDLVNDKENLLPFITEISNKMNFHAVIPMSAKTGKNTASLEEELKPLCPEGPKLFPDDMVTDRNIRFLAAEMIREKLFRTTAKELPYSLTVDIEEFELKKKVYHVSALILVEREGQKKIIIGQDGEKLKSIGKQARLDLEKMLGKKVYLRMWVKVKSGWSDDDRALRNLGYTDF